MTIESTSFRVTLSASPLSSTAFKCDTCCIGSRRKYEPGTHLGNESLSDGEVKGPLTSITTSNRWFAPSVASTLNTIPELSMVHRCSMQCIGSVLHSGQLHRLIRSTIFLRVLVFLIPHFDAIIVRAILIYRYYRPVHQTTGHFVRNRFLNRSGQPTIEQPPRYNRHRAMFEGEDHRLHEQLLWRA